MTADHDQHVVEAMRNLWVSVLEMTIRDYKSRIQAARRRDRWASIDGVMQQVMSLETEILYARLYFTSDDGRDVMEMAGYGHQPQRIMDYLTGDLEQPIKERDREIARMFRNGVPINDLSKAFQLQPKSIRTIVGAAA